MQESKKKLLYQGGEGSYIFLHWVCPKLPSKDIEDLLPYPAALGEGGKGEVVGVDLPQTCVGEKSDTSHLGHFLFIVIVSCHHVTMVICQHFTM